MKKKSPYDIIKSRYVTEKASVLEGLRDNASNRSVAACDKPKAVFLVDKKANKQEIAQAIEEIYAEKKVTVKKVNTILIKPKKRRVRGKLGYKSAYKKAVVTLGKEENLGDSV